MTIMCNTNFTQNKKNKPKDSKQYESTNRVNKK